MKTTLLLIVFAFILAPLSYGANTGRYHVQVETGRIDKAGTDANIQIKLYGDKGETIKHLLDKDNYDDFEKGDIDVYSFTDKDVGNIHFIQIQHDNRGDSSGWYLVRITIRAPNNNRYTFTYDDWIPDEQTMNLLQEVLEDSLKTDPRLSQDRIQEEVIGYTYDVIDNTHGSQEHTKSVEVEKDITAESMVLTDRITDQTVSASGSGGVNLGVFSVGAKGGYKLREFLRRLENQHVRERMRILENVTWVVPAGEILIVQYAWKANKRKGIINWAYKQFQLGLALQLKYDVTLASLKQVNGRIPIPSTLNRPFINEIQSRFPNSYIDQSGTAYTIVIKSSQMQRMRRSPIDVASLTGGRRQAERPAARPRARQTQDAVKQPVKVPQQSATRPPIIPIQVPQREAERSSSPPSRESIIHPQSQGADTSTQEENTDSRNWAPLRFD